MALSDEGFAAAQADFLPCSETHPTTGDVCSLDRIHVQNSDPKVKQHVAANGIKWPTLHELDPKEGFNVYVTRGV
jgi:hypothetical protein